MHLKALAIQ